MKWRIADAKRGLREVKDMNDLISTLESVGEKEWFRTQMGMSRGALLVRCIHWPLGTQFVRKVDLSAMRDLSDNAIKFE